MKRLFLFLILSGILTSCSDVSSDSKTEISDTPVKFYAIGSKVGMTTENKSNPLATVWVDNIPTILSNTGFSSVANAITFDNNDRYIVGTESYENGTSFIKLWKNNSVENITQENHYADATDIFVSQGNVYISGNEYIDFLSVATIWKNGKPIHLTTNISSRVYAVYVYNDDIYAAGYKIVNDKSIAVIWKNGVETIWYNENNDWESKAIDVCFDGKNIYAVGEAWTPPGAKQFKKITLQWKNNTSVILPSIKRISVPRAMYVYNSDVFVCGYEFDDYKFDGKVWKNGAIFKELNHSQLVSINIKNNKLYIGGFYIKGTLESNASKIWEYNLNNLEDIKEYSFPYDYRSSFFVN